MSQNISVAKLSDLFQALSDKFGALPEDTLCTVKDFVSNVISEHFDILKRRNSQVHIELMEEVMEEVD